MSPSTVDLRWATDGPWENLGRAVACWLARAWVQSLRGARRQRCLPVSRGSFGQSTAIYVCYVCE